MSGRSGTSRPLRKPDAAQSAKSYAEFSDSHRPGGAAGATASEGPGAFVAGYPDGVDQGRAGPDEGAGTSSDSWMKVTYHPIPTTPTPCASYDAGREAAGPGQDVLAHNHHPPGRERRAPSKRGTSGALNNYDWTEERAGPSGPCAACWETWGETSHHRIFRSAIWRTRGGSAKGSTTRVCWRSRKTRRWTT